MWPMPTRPRVLPPISRAHQVLAAVAAVPPQPAVVLGDALAEVEHQSQRVLGHRPGVGARLVHDEHAGPGAGGDVDGVVAGADRGNAEQPGAAFEQLRAGEPLPRQFILRRGDLVGVSLGQVRPGVLLRPGEVAGPQLDVGLAREPLGHRRVVMEVEAHHDLVLLSHRFLLPRRVCAAQSLRGQDRHRAQAGRRSALAVSTAASSGLLPSASDFRGEAFGLLLLQRLTFGKHRREMSNSRFGRSECFASLAATPEHSAVQAAMAGGELAHEHPLPGDPANHR